MSETENRKTQDDDLLDMLTEKEDVTTRILVDAIKRLKASKAEHESAVQKELESVRGELRSQTTKMTIWLAVLSVLMIATLAMGVLLIISSNTQRREARQASDGLSTRIALVETRQALPTATSIPPSPTATATLVPPTPTSSPSKPPESATTPARRTNTPTHTPSPAPPPTFSPTPVHTPTPDLRIFWVEELRPAGTLQYDNATKKMDVRFTFKVHNNTKNLLRFLGLSVVIENQDSDPANIKQIDLFGIPNAEIAAGQTSEFSAGPFTKELEPEKTYLAHVYYHLTEQEHGKAPDSQGKTMPSTPFKIPKK